MHRADRARGAAGAPDAGGEGRSKRMAESPWPRPKLGFRCGRVAAVLAAAGRPDERGEGAPSRRTVDGHRSGAERCPRGRHRSVKRHRGAMRRERRYEKEQCPGSPSRSSRPVGNWPGGEAPVAGRQWLGTSGWAPVGEFGRYLANGSRGAQAEFGPSWASREREPREVAGETPEIGRYPANGGRIAPAPCAREWLDEVGVSNSQFHESPQKRHFSAVFLTSVSAAQCVTGQRQTVGSRSIRPLNDVGLPRWLWKSTTCAGLARSPAFGPRDRPPERATQRAVPRLHGAPEQRRRTHATPWG